MRTSNDFFDQLPTSFNDLDTPFIPRPTVPLVPKQLFSTTPTEKILAVHKISYPVLKPVATRPVVSARKQAEQKLEQELAQADKMRKSLDQLIQHAANIQSQQATQPQPPPPKPVEKPKYQAPSQPPKEFWWPNQQTIQIKEIPPVVIKPAPRPKPIAPIVAKTTPLPIPTPAKVVPAAEPASNQEKADYGGAPELIDYFLPIINHYEDPFDEGKRKIVIYSLKIFGYLTLLLGIFEFKRYLGLGLNINGIFEILSIFTIAGIFLLFGGNLNILFKPVNPYQIQEV